MTTFTAQEIEFLQKHSNEVEHPTLQQITSVNLTFIYLLVNLLAFFYLLPHNHHPIFGPPFPPIADFLSPLLALPPPPYQTPSAPFSLLPLSPPTPRSVNTSGWASMMTGHQLFQISESHKKLKSFYRKNMKRKDGNIFCLSSFDCNKTNDYHIICYLITKLLSSCVLDAKVCSTRPGKGSPGLCVRILSQQHRQYPRSPTSQGPAAQ